MYAIIEDGSRQYRVEEGGLVVIDHREIEAGQRLELGKVLLLSSGADTLIGAPLVEARGCWPRWSISPASRR